MPRAQPGQRFGGRQKGSLNKHTASIKEALYTTFERLGGVEHMVDWASAYPSDFYKIFAKTLPTEIEASLKADFTKTLRVEFVESRNIADSSGVPRLIEQPTKI